jgi:hypothetical protein
MSKNNQIINDNKAEINNLNNNYYNTVKDKKALEQNTLEHKVR